MGWDVLSQIATSLGALAAGGSFVLYRLKRRDELTSHFRLTVTTLRPNVEQVHELVSFEFAYELAAAAVCSPVLELPLRDFYAHARPRDGDPPDRDRMTEYLRKNFPVITVPLNTPMASRYREITIEIAMQIAPFQNSFPGMHRIAKATIILMENCLRNAKTITRTDELWETALPSLIEQDKRITSVEHLQRVFTDVLTMVLMRDMQESQERIGPLSQMLVLVCDAYLEKTVAELSRLSRAERKEKVRAFAEIQTISEELREVEKCLRHVFSRESQRQRYRELLAAYECVGREQAGEDFSEEGAGSGGP
ncbi:MAG TPA: hypothetical protein VEQ41_02885 [Solirubrobacterales bacterium]|nr:hypothetical protein [Solirubrobacterales bacterium]